MPEIFSFNIGVSALQKQILLASLTKDKAVAFFHFEQFKLELFKIDSDISKALLKLDIDSSRLLANVYFNLMSFQDPVLSHLKSVYKVNTIRGKYYLNIAIQIAQVLEKNNVPYIFLKGVPTVLLTHNNFGIRPMTDIDVLVPPEKMELALKVIQSEFNLKIRNYDLPFYENNIIHAITLRRSTNLQIDLHFYFHNFAYHTNDDAVLWESSNRALLSSNQYFNMPSLTFLLYRNLIHGTEGKAIRWVADALAIIEFSGGKINWQSLFDMAKVQNVLWPIIKRLNYLNSEFSIILPEEVIILIKKSKISIQEKIYFYYLTNNLNPNLNRTLKFKFSLKCFFVLDFYLFRRTSEKKGIVNYFFKRKKVLKFIKDNYGDKSPYD